MYRKIFCCLFIYPSVLFYNFTPVNVLNVGNLSASHHLSSSRFGPFYVDTKSVENCEPSKPIDKEFVFDNHMYVTKINRMKEEYRGYLVVPKDVVVAEGSLKCMLTNGRTKTTMYEKKSKAPCSEMIFTTIANFFTKLAMETCTVKKSNYTVENVDVNKIVHAMVGENFVHETMSFKLEFFSKKGSIYCVEFIFESKPLNGKKMGGRKKPNSRNNTTMSAGEASFIKNKEI